MLPRIKRVTRSWQAWFVLACLIVLAAEYYLLFLKRVATFSIEGNQRYAIEEFSDGRTVSHDFFMRGDGLTSIRVNLGVAAPAAASAVVEWTLLRRDRGPEAPKRLAAQGTIVIETREGRRWRTLSFVRDGSSNDRWYTILLRRIDTGAATRLSLMATHDNPARGGVLTVDGRQRPGSLMMRASRVGRTLYQRFETEVEDKLPPALQLGVVQWIAALVIHGALVVYAYLLLRASLQVQQSVAFSPPYLAIFTLNADDATTTLFFRNLQARGGVRLNIATAHGQMVDALAGASAVIVVRALLERRNVIRAARVLNIPAYYFIDDNFIMIRREGGPAARFLAEYRKESVTEALQSVHAVLVASAPLRDYYCDQALHSTVQLFPPTISPTQFRHDGRSDTTTFAFFGGSHLEPMLFELVLPALRRAAVDRPIRLVCVGVSRRVADGTGLEVVELPYFTSYPKGVEALARERVDVLLHPTAAILNSSYKNPHALITANALGAIPIVSARTPYTAAMDHVSLRCDDTESSWHDAIVRSTEPEHRRRVLQNLNDYCEAHFSGAQGMAALSAMLDRTRPPSLSTRLWRRLVAGVFVADDFYQRLGRRLFRSK